MNMKPRRLTLAGKIAPFIIIGVATIYELRYVLWDDLYVDPTGEINFSQNAKLSSAINRYMEMQSKLKTTCVHDLYGYDDRYGYVGLLCGVFKKTNSGAYAMERGSNIPTRVEFDRFFKIIKYTQTREGTSFDSSFRSLFPKATKSRYLQSQKQLNNLMKAGLQRQMSK
ncbi:MAG: hypothetical protein ISR65_07565 [Bacteriovoracaceae bacterium]|nr:hypothetical protein [Bacteriovoracaceae bacterium]